MSTSTEPTVQPEVPTPDPSRKRKKISGLSSLDATLLYEDIQRCQSRVAALDVEDATLQQDLESVLDRLQAKLKAPKVVFKKQLHVLGLV